MTPINFKESNVLLGRPPGMTEEECSGLHIFTNQEVCISRWKLNWKERLQILFVGEVWLGVMSGKTQPPVWLKSNYPFIVINERVAKKL